MEIDVKVYSSKITRELKADKNDLYDLLDIAPVRPINLNRDEKSHCEFKPRSDKHYEPKRNSKLKVKTVRDIRNVFEKDIYSFLPHDLEKQQNILLKKIRGGSSRSEKTKKLARDIINCDNPISRPAWQMLKNINPDEHTYSKQYVLWNGKRIHVCGSKGGKIKYISNVDNKRKKPLNYRVGLKKSAPENKKKGLLQNSLAVKFKPGPLTLKKYLDNSYQKYHVGNIELVNLPKIGLDIQSTYGCALDSTISNFLNSFRDVSGTISEKWAEFAVSVLGNVKDTKAVQCNNGTNVTFDVGYICDQSRILMRRDIDSDIHTGCANQSDSVAERFFGSNRESDVMPEIKNMICEMIDCIEISIKQDSMYSGQDEERCESTDTVLNITSNQLSKEKPKNKYTELNRLHVTVIKLAEHSVEQNNKIGVCNNLHCSLGCVCSSLGCSLNLRRHCGRIDCMFECKCDFSKWKALDSFDSECPEFLPELYNLDRDLNLKLAKEEQKFHQTVIMTGEKSIVLESQKRNWKASRKYPDFYKNMPLKVKHKENRILTIIATKLNSENIEPWCMVHNLYKCFCKGMFVDTFMSSLEPPNPVQFKERISTKTDVKTNEINDPVRPHVQVQRTNSLTKNYPNSNSDDSDFWAYECDECARVKPYEGRKYSHGYYENTNRKIWEMEKNDINLRNKLENVLKMAADCNKTKLKINTKDTLSVSSNSTSNDSSKPAASSKNHITETRRDDNSCIRKESDESSIESAKMSRSYIISTSSSEDSNSNFSSNRDLPKTDDMLINSLKKPDSSLRTWLEHAFKQYKKSCENGGLTTLQAPKPNKLALYPWNFILSRYKEGKNHFLVSKQRPYRMFMAVDGKHPFFLDCININTIGFADLYKYPVTVVNLLTNATDLKDSFCILSGLKFCWELKGAMTKIIEPNSNSTLNKVEIEISETERNKQPSETCGNPFIENELHSKNNEVAAEPNLDENEKDSENSKWFVMTVENDFNEILFSKKGFFVTYGNIIHALGIARLSGKTARLSGQKSVDKSNSTQFGVYAIPNVNVDCVFIGPYECNESLGIETVKSISDISKPNRTRGFWITTNKVDNMKVIDNPMSFVPSKVLDNNTCVPLIGECSDLNENTSTSVLEATNKRYVETQNPNYKTHGGKIVKPIKIRKSDGFYQVTPKTIINSTLQNRDAIRFTLKSDTITFSSAGPTHPSQQTRSVMNISDATKEENKSSSLKPPKVSPQIKITSVFSQAENSNKSKEGKLGTMFILKPEQINEKILENISSCNKSKAYTKEDIDNSQCNVNETSMEMDIENFLANSAVSPESDSDVYIISDDDENTSCTNDTEKCLKEVWIECKNISNLGWILGQQNADKQLSFKFPGFQFSELYPEEVTFYKINQVLSRKVCMPKNIKLEWHVVNTESELTSTNQLKSEDFGPDIVLTKRGLRQKHDLLKSIVRNFKTYSREPHSPVTKTEEEKTSDKMEIELACNEETSTEEII